VLAHLLDASGGLGYHLRALGGRRRWAPFIGEVAGWLQAWQPPRDELVVVGPSAGYTLDAAFLARFRRITALEPDPLARYLLGRRFPAFAFDDLDCLMDAEGPARLAARFPRSAILFANVLGQVRDAAAMPALAAALRAALAEHRWASYHDLLSAPQRPRAALPPTLAAAGDAAALARRLWADQAVAVTDHGTAGLLPGPARLALWDLARGACQVVAWQTHPPLRG
jgi:hypothetical protein